MSENKQFIAFFSWITGVFLILTYIFSVVKFTWRFLSSDFLVVAFGGLFASFGVMLLAEIKKYFINKRSAEDMLYFTLLRLYTELIVEAKNAEVYLNNQDSMVPDNLFKDRVPQISGYIYSLRNIDYAPFRKNKIESQWTEYRMKELPNLNDHVIICNTHLFLAINQEKMKALDRGLAHYHPIGKDHDVNVTLKKTHADAIARTLVIEKMQDVLFSAYSNRYMWEKEKERLQSLEIGLPTENPNLKAFFEE